MKSPIKKWALRIIGAGLFIVVLLLIIVLNPTLLYANKTRFGNYTVYHNKLLDKNFETIINKATDLVKSSEVYNPSLNIEICLNDGSCYPGLIKFFQQQAFGIGFYDKVVLMGTMNSKENYVALNGYKWNLVQLLAHEEIHCYQFDKLGLWKSNPVAKYPAWKWEGYNEYVARQNPDQINLSKNIDRLNEVEKNNKDDWGISFADSTFAGKYYYDWWLMMQYCKNVKKMSYLQILADTTNAENISAEMMAWYDNKEH